MKLHPGPPDCPGKMGVKLPTSPGLAGVGKVARERLRLKKFGQRLLRHDDWFVLTVKNRTTSLIYAFPNTPALGLLPQPQVVRP